MSFKILYILMCIAGKMETRFAPWLVKRSLPYLNGYKVFRTASVLCELCKIAYDVMGNIEDTNRQVALDVSVDSLYDLLGKINSVVGVLMELDELFEIAEMLFTRAAQIAQSTTTYATLLDLLLRQVYALAAQLACALADEASRYGHVALNLQEKGLELMEDKMTIDHFMARNYSETKTWRFFPKMIAI